MPLTSSLSVACKLLLDFGLNERQEEYDVVVENYSNRFKESHRLCKNADANLNSFAVLVWFDFDCWAPMLFLLCLQCVYFSYWSNTKVYLCCRHFFYLYMVKIIIYLYVSYLSFIFGLCEHLSLFSLIHFQVFILRQMRSESLPNHWVWKQPQTNGGHLFFKMPFCGSF